MAYEVTSGITIPKKEGVGTKAKYPFKEMDVGDSFFIPAEDYKNKNPNYMYSNLHYSAKFQGIKIAVRTLKDKSGMRVWRVK